MRRAAKRDASEPAIIEALEAAGCTVHRLSDKDLPDLLIGRLGRDYTAEVKTGKAKLRPGQETWAEHWNGARPLVLRTVADVERWLVDRLLVDGGKRDERQIPDRGVCVVGQRRRRNAV